MFGYKLVKTSELKDFKKDVRELLHCFAHQKEKVPGFLQRVFDELYKDCHYNEETLDKIKSDIEEGLARYNSHRR